MRRRLAMNNALICDLMNGKAQLSCVRRALLGMRVPGSVDCCATVGLLLC